jgi:hypothetical protein
VATKSSWICCAKSAQTCAFNTNSLADRSLHVNQNKQNQQFPQKAGSASLHQLMHKKNFNDFAQTILPLQLAKLSCGIFVQY